MWEAGNYLRFKPLKLRAKAVDMQEFVSICDFSEDGVRGRS